MPAEMTTSRAVRDVRHMNRCRSEHQVPLGGERPRPCGGGPPRARTGTVVPRSRRGSRTGGAAPADGCRARSAGATPAGGPPARPAARSSNPSSESSSFSSSGITCSSAYGRTVCRHRVLEELSTREIAVGVQQRWQGGRLLDAGVGERPQGVGPVPGGPLERLGVPYDDQRRGRSSVTPGTGRAGRCRRGRSGERAASSGRNQPRSSTSSFAWYVERSSSPTTWPTQ